MRMREYLEKEKKYYFEKYIGPISSDDYKKAIGGDVDFKNEVDKYIVLSEKLFLKLKQEGFLKSEQILFPAPDKLLKNFIRNQQNKTNFEDMLSIYLQFSKTNMITSICNIFSGYRRRHSVQIILFSYLMLSESILFLFEDIIKNIYHSKKDKELPYVVLEKLYEAIIRNKDYEEFSDLFKHLNKNLRNAIAHFNYSIGRDTVVYHFVDNQKNKSEKIGLNQLHKDFLRLLILFHILHRQIDKTFTKELKGLVYEGILPDPSTKSL